MKQRTENLVTNETQLYSIYKAKEILHGELAAL
jgi:hypothetical protein